MRRKPYGRKLLFLILILVFFLSACSESKTQYEGSEPVQEQSTEESTFQEYLWGQHSLDLMIQIGLLLAGSLGVVVLLPTPDEE